jgi:phytoene dehydrogenase-like protein
MDFREKSVVIVGSGAGGLTAALLFAKAGYKVTIVESQRTIGGYLRRFKRDGVSFDTGYHFSGGFDSTMQQMNTVLGLQKYVKSELINHRIVLPGNGIDLNIAKGADQSGYSEIIAQKFSSDSIGIKRFFEAERDVWFQTPMRDLCDTSKLQTDFSKYDLQSTGEFFAENKISADAALCCASFALCHGTPPSEASFSFHSRACYCLHNDLSRPLGGGDVFIEGFKEEAKKYQIKIITSAEITSFGEIDTNGECRSCTLSNGEKLYFDQLVFTIHPSAFAKILPDKAMTPSLTRRICRLQESCSFFSVFAKIDPGTKVTPGLISYFTGNDLDDILLNNHHDSSTGIMINDENGTLSLNAFKTMQCNLPAHTSFDHRSRINDAIYQEFKEKMTSEICEEITSVLPELKGKIKILDSGTPLSCMDYDPPTGSAYGARAICGQPRIFGKLPISNLFAAGQSSLVPGVMGTMLASFCVFRAAAGEDAYARLIKKTLV